MEITALGYIGINSSQLDQWGRMATELLGMQQVDRGGKMRAFRMDDHKQRLVIDGSSDAGLAVMGWEVPSAADIDRLAGRLESHGVKVTRGSRALADERHVAELVVFSDPAGNRLEAFCEPELAIEPFKPGRPISGFRTGALGMGHVVLNVEDVELLVPFYRDVLGFQVSDFGLKPTGSISSTSTAVTTPLQWSAQGGKRCTISWSNLAASMMSGRATTSRSWTTAASPTRWAGTPTTT
ncbi:Biphenyl23diol 12dioxygenase EC 1131139 [Bradyrhizobium sp.]|nr:Biphenyl23diol 12dioxygenase EC 1131139 [Bradyrhizobium sp.]